jgi:hypothetical protein
LKNNIAGRMHGVLSKWRSQPDSSPAIRGWGAILEIPRGSKDWTVYHRVGLLVDELELLREQLGAKDLTPSNYEPYLAQVDLALSPRQIALKTDHVKQYVKPEVLAALALCSDVIGHEEEAISTEQFADIARTINDLAQSLEDPSIPASLKVIIQRHIQLIETAISEYPLVGAKALTEATKRAFIDIATEADPAQMSTPPGTALKRMWTKANELANGAIKTDRLIQAGERLAKYLEFIG